MSLYDDIKKNDELILEHGLYEKAMVELETDILDKGSWGKALVESNGDEVIARGLYIKHRVQILKDHIVADALRMRKARLEAARTKAELEQSMAQQEKEKKMAMAQLEQQKKDSDADVQQRIKSRIGDPDIAISKLKVAKGVRLAQDLVNILGIEKSEGKEGTFYLIKGGSMKHSNLHDALIEHILKFGFK